MKQLRDAISAHEDARKAHVELMEQVSQHERELPLANSWAAGALAEVDRTAGKLHLGKATYEDLATAERNRAEADELSRRTTSAIKLLKEELPVATAKVASAKAAESNTCVTLASPLIAKSKAKIERLASELADEIHRAARLAAFDGGLPHAERLVHVAGNPAAILRGKGILTDAVFDHKLRDGIDELSAEDLLKMLDEAAAQ